MYMCFCCFLVDIHVSIYLLLSFTTNVCKTSLNTKFRQHSTVRQLLIFVAYSICNYVQHNTYGNE